MARAVGAIASWMRATDGIPAHSSSAASRKLRALHEPQPPKPVIATDASEVSRLQSPGSGGTDTLPFTTGSAATTGTFAASSSYNAPRKSSARPRPLMTSPTTAPSSRSGRRATDRLASVGGGPLVGSRATMSSLMSAPFLPSDVGAREHRLGDRATEVGEHDPGLGHPRA